MTNVFIFIHIHFPFVGEEMFQLKDRKDGEYCLAPTHEEGIHFENDH
jgi:prolyl-tRNA synthetase